ncbi:MAG: hypothetical protein PHV20_07615 [Bacteroidales bacterium]|nr:hypothetical protein [Bacteroidales bacterium]
MKTINLKKSEFAILTESSVESNVPNQAGIYLIWTKKGIQGWECVSVEPSTNLKSDLLNRLSSGNNDENLRLKLKNLIFGYEWALVSRK